MKFDKAYCHEIGEAITPYAARELYFDEESEFFKKKLSFKCEVDYCRVDLVPVIIYSSKRSKKTLHFRTKPKQTHHDDCIYNERRNEESGCKKRANKAERYKKTRIPSEFLLERLQKNILGTTIKAVDEEFHEQPSKVITMSPSGKERKGKAIVKTSCLDHLVDCFLNASSSELKKHVLTINGKTKYFRNYFKKIEYFQDEEGLVYWGKIKEIKPYGKNYRIQFKKRAWSESEHKYLSLSIYVTDDLINSYRKKKLFRDQLDGLSDADQDILCFFIGAYPQISEVQTYTRPFKVWSIDIPNLDHLAFTFDKLP